MNILQMKNNYLLIKVDFEKLLKKIIKTTKDQKKKTSWRFKIFKHKGALTKNKINQANLSTSVRKQWN